MRPATADAAGMDTHDLAATRVRRFLETEPVVWLSSVCGDGSPHLVPTWFVWDGAAIVIVSKPGAVKARNLRADPRAMLALGDADDDFDVGLLEATARLSDTPTPLGLPPGFLVKYGERIASLGLTPAQFARTYSQVIRLIPVKALGWHGRTAPGSVRLAARRIAAVGAASLSEPRNRPHPWLGEPLAKGLGGSRFSPGGVSI
jgi:PPOX class probable F420-dependent enzyme